ncbi:hypothetical protein RB595_007938 [Gaeumannomyces hyphopodioides]
MSRQAENYQPSWVERIGISTFELVNRFVPWFKLPAYIGTFSLAFLRILLRAHSLHDSYDDPSAQGTPGEYPLGEDDDRFRHARHSDGMHNDLSWPLMGCRGMRFGRNFPRERCPKPTEEGLWSPNPRLISERFMARREFIPATTLNLLAAAWIYWAAGGRKMELPKTKPDAVLDPSDAKCPGYRNKNTAWWDGSQIYGSSEAVTASLRGQEPDGKLALNKDGTGAFLPRDAQGNPLTGFHSNRWVGTELLHTPFALEHNSLYDELRGLHPGWTGDQVFDKARLVNCALMPKIHTAEWTPAILAHPALEVGMSANRWGLVGERLTRLVGRVSRTSEIISGIPGSGVEHDGVPYSLTEEVVSVCRMHSLVPDDVAFFSASRRNDQHVATTPMRDLAFERARKPLEGGKTPFPQNKELADRLSEAYGGDVTKVDALVGSHSKPVISGFGFSDTAFRIFILMASRCLKSDRFIAGQQWDEDTYTREGLRWVQGTSMKNVLARHFPELAGTLGESEKVFAPWAKMERSKGYKGKETNAPGK